MNQRNLSTTMNNKDPKILYMHGLDSSKDSTKFSALSFKNKFCINIDYRNLNFDAVERFYCEIIEKIIPDIIVGHGLGGYWALKMSKRYEIPAVIANPSLAPSFNSEYPALSDEDLNHDIPQYAYIELGDELIDMKQTADVLELYMDIECITDGKHQLDHPERINHLIQHMITHFMRM